MSVKTLVPHSVTSQFLLNIFDILKFVFKED
nr:MAG TPA: hypothetical protein [Caudoviricetes sp.]